MKAQWEREGTHALYRGEWSASCPGTSLDILRSTKSLASAGIQTPDYPVCGLVPILTTIC